MNSSSLVPDNSSDSWLLCRSTPGAYAIARDSSVAGDRKPLGSRSRVAQGEDGNKRGSVGAFQKNPGRETVRAGRAQKMVSCTWRSWCLVRAGAHAGPFSRPPYRGRATGRPSATTALCASLLCLSSLSTPAQLCCERTTSGIHKKRA